MGILIHSQRKVTVEQAKHSGILAFPELHVRKFIPRRGPVSGKCCRMLCFQIDFYIQVRPLRGGPGCSNWLLLAPKLPALV